MAKRLLLIVSVVFALLLFAAPANADGHGGYPPKAPEAPEAPSKAVVQPPAAVPSAPPVVTPSALPRTGDDTSMALARGAIVMVAAGGILTLVARRRLASLD
jgi:hypothetical protein